MKPYADKSLNTHSFEKKIITQIIANMKPYADKSKQTTTYLKKNYNTNY